MVERGPLEQAVWDGLKNRPAGIINGASRGAERCFGGMFSGCQSRGSVYNGSLNIGKAECEWDWEKTWAELKELGLIDWTVEEKPNHPDIGGTSTFVHLAITDKGREVRADDIRWFREVMDARDQDGTLE